MVHPLARFDGTLISSHGADVWAHPGAAPLLGPELAQRRTAVDLVRRAADRAAGESLTRWPVERAVLLFGSGAMPGIVPDPGDLDLVLRLRHRPPERAADPAQAHGRIAPVTAAFLRSLCLALVEQGATFVRLVTIWDGPFAGASRVPAGTTVSWSLPAVACGRLVSAVGAVTLGQAAFECGVVKVMVLIHIGGRLTPVEVAIDSSFVCPGGVCDVSASFTAFWFGKVAFTEAEARIGAGHEAELAALFPDRYRSDRFGRELAQAAASDKLRQGDLRKAVGLAALLHAMEGDGAGVADAARVAGSGAAVLAGLGARLSAVVKYRCGRELSDADGAAMIESIRADAAGAPGLPECSRWLEELARVPAADRIDPHSWAHADELADRVHAAGVRELAREYWRRPAFTRVLAPDLLDKLPQA